MGTKNHAHWPGWTPHKALVLSISPEHWAPPEHPVEVDGLTFLPRHDLHVTLVERGLGRSLSAERSGRQAVRDAFVKLDWEFTRTGELLQLEKREIGGRGRGRAIGSIIERIELPAMAQFYEQLALLLGRGLAIPPPHVTLYTTGRAQGIAVPDVATLQRLTVRELPALSSQPRDGSQPHARHH